MAGTSDIVTKAETLLETVGADVKVLQGFVDEFEPLIATLIPSEAALLGKVKMAVDTYGPMIESIEKDVEALGEEL